MVKDDFIKLLIVLLLPLWLCRKVNHLYTLKLQLEECTAEKEAVKEAAIVKADHEQGQATLLRIMIFQMHHQCHAYKILYEFMEGAQNKIIRGGISCLPSPCHILFGTPSISHTEFEGITLVMHFDYRDL